MIGRLISTSASVLAFGVAFAAQPALAGALDSTWVTKIENACVSQLDKKQSTTPRSVCKCIANAHFKSAQEESDQKEAVTQLKWTVALYEAKDSAMVASLMQKDEVMSEFDMQVATECSDRTKPKKPEPEPEKAKAPAKKP